MYVELKSHHGELAPNARRYSGSDEEWVRAILASMDDPRMTFLVAEEDDAVLGFTRFAMQERSYGKSCEIETVVVSSEARERGIGTLLMEEAEGIARRDGAVGVRVNVLAVNDRGREFYEDLGYSVLAIRYGKEL